MRTSILVLLLSLSPLCLGALQCNFGPISTINCIDDKQGADDQPEQKDINRFCTRDTGIDYFSLYWTLDDFITSTTYTSCALFDTNGDGLVNQAICVNAGPASKTSKTPVFKSLTYYTCGNGYSDRCSNPIVVADPGSQVCCGVSVQTVDPFHSALPNLQDTVVQCNLISELRGSLSNVCTFPSGPGSSTGDCILFTGTCTTNADCQPVPSCKTGECVGPVGAKICVLTSQADGTSCGPAPGVCGALTCSSGACIQSFLPSTTVCRVAAGNNSCDAAEKCSGEAVSCPDDGFLSPGTNCGAGATDCSAADTCSASGVCQRNDKPAGAVCGTGNVGITSCSNADSCDGNGACTQLNHRANGTLCGTGNIGVTSCSGPDACDGTGLCTILNNKAPGVVCGTGNVGISSCSEADLCDANGACSNPNNKVDGASCGFADLCVQEKCFSGICKWAQGSQSFATQTAAQTAANDVCNVGKTCYSYTCVGNRNPGPCVPSSTLKPGNPCPAVTDPTCQKLCCIEGTTTCTRQDLCVGLGGAAVSKLG